MSVALGCIALLISIGLSAFVFYDRRITKQQNERMQKITEANKSFVKVDFTNQFHQGCYEWLKEYVAIILKGCTQNDLTKEEIVEILKHQIDQIDSEIGLLRTKQMINQKHPND